MTRIYTLTILLLIGILSSHAKDTIFDRYSEEDGVTTVYISKAMLSMMSNIDTGGFDIGPIASKLDQIRILTCEKKSLAQKIAKDTETMASADKEYEKFVSINEKDEKTAIWMKSLPDGKNEYLITVLEPSELTIIFISGSVTAADTQNLIH